MLTQSPLAFAILKYAGGVYLVYLGIRTLSGAIRGTSTPKGASGAKDPTSSWACFAQGLLTNLLNPKVAVFYLTFLPQFVAPERSVLSQSLFLATTHVLMGLAWLTLYAHFIDRMAAVLLTDRVTRRIEAVTGAVLMALGLRLALAKR